MQRLFVNLVLVTTAVASSSSHSLITRDDSPLSSVVSTTDEPTKPTLMLIRRKVTSPYENVSGTDISATELYSTKESSSVDCISCHLSRFFVSDSPSSHVSEWGNDLLKDPPIHEEDEESEWAWQPMVWSWWVILQMVTALLGIVGNLLVIVVLYRRREHSRSMDNLVGALAAADLLTSVFMCPLPQATRVPSSWAGELYCKVIYTSMFMWISVDASIFTLTEIPIERLIAVAYPLHAKRILTRRRVSTVIFLNWLVAFLANVFLLVISRVDATTQQCSLVHQSRAAQLSSGWILFMLQFFLPSLFTLSMQLLTARALHRQSRQYLGDKNQVDKLSPSMRHLVAKKRVMEMLFIVVILFIICWGPSQCAYLAFNLGLLPTSYLYGPLNRALVILSFCNSCANPFIYTARYPEFRKAVVDLFTSGSTSQTSIFGLERERK
ncbi:galanin receptor 2a-like [Diadema antillarum]|uniref:galanin receptor 2a-like n=1 Tax=Diadema antillarum TaxID=105358 RepID=UPI003A853D9D